MIRKDIQNKKVLIETSQPLLYAIYFINNYDYVYPIQLCVVYIRILNWHNGNILHSYFTS